MIQFLLHTIFTLLLIFPLIARAEEKLKHKVTKFEVNYEQALGEELAGGLPLALGSSLYTARESTGYVLYFLTDRGPAVDKPLAKLVSAVKEDQVYYLRSDFLPFWASVRIRDGKAKVDQIGVFRSSAGEPLKGMPEKKKVRKKAKKNFAGNWHPTDGIDPEGIALDSSGNMWIANELGPSLLLFSKTNGALLKVYSPGAGLPAVLSWIQENRGFEGVAVTKTEMLYAAVQSPLDIQKKTKNRALFVRFVEVDLLSGKVRCFAYPISDDNTDRANVRISDLAVVGKSSLLVIEQGKSKKKSYQRVYLADLKDASEILLTPNPADEPEFLNDKKKVFGKDGLITKPIKKKLILDLSEVKWPYDKPEGISILDDLKTIVLTHDNDFGVMPFTTWQKLKKNEKKLGPIDKKRRTEVWFIELEKPIL